MRDNILLMKRYIIPQFILVLVLCLIYIGCSEKESKFENKFFTKEYGSTNPEKRYEREVKRLADPTTGKIPIGIRSKELLFAHNLPTQHSFNRGNGYNWKAQGPFNVGGRTRAAGVDINNENILIAGGNSGTIYRSIDGGKSWNKAETPYLAVGASCIAQDTRTGKTNTWYIGTGERYSSASGNSSSVWLGNGILKSTDNGLTWDTLSSTTSNTPQSFDNFDKIWSIALDPSKTEDVLYVATNRIIYKSTDGGDSFTSVLNSTNTGSYSYSNVMCTPSGTLYATFGSDGSKKGIWRSSDGDNWIKITPTDIGTSYNRIISAFDPNNENVVYFLGNTPNAGKEAVNFKGDSEWNSLLKYEYLSGDGSGTGGEWTNLSANLPEGPYMFDDFNVQGSYDMTIAVKPDNSNTIIIGGTNLYRSTDGFTTNTNTKLIGGYKEDTELPLFETYPNHHPDQHTAFFAPSNPKILYSGSDGGFAKTNDITATPVVWESLNKGYITTQFYTVAIDHGTKGSNTIIGGLQDNGSQFTSSADETADWTMSFSYDGAYCAIPDGADNYYMSIQLGRIVKLDLDAVGNLKNYRRIDPIVSNPDVYDFINPFVLDPVDNNIMYLSVGNKLWRNDDLYNITISNEWDSITQGWTELTGTAQGNISAFGVTHTGSHTLYIGTDGGKVYKLTNASTTDATFENVSTGVSGFVSSISVDPRDDNKVLLTVSNYNVKSVYYTENGGTTWWRVSGNLEGEPTNSIAPETYTTGPYPSARWCKIIPTVDGNTLYLVGTSVGLVATDRLVLGTDYYSDTTTWYLQSPDLIGNNVVTMIDYRESDGFTVVATHGAGVFTTYINNTWEMADVKENKILSFKLFPNPASDQIQILSEISGNKGVIIYDIQGKMILNTSTPSNYIDVSSFSKGTYTLELTSNGEIIGKQKFIKN